MTAEHEHERYRSWLLRAVEEVELSSVTGIMWSIVPFVGEPVLHLRWRDGGSPPGLARATVYHLGERYFIQSFFCRAGPLSTLEQALVVLLGDDRIPVTADLEEIRSTEWSHDEIVRRLRLVEAPAALTINDTEWRGELPPESP